MILVLGKGLSGKAAEKLLKSKGFQVIVYDDKSPVSVPSEIEFAVKSPGVPPDHFLIKELKSKGIEVIGEIELAYRYAKGRIVSVTGTNGKSTTTALIYHVLKEAGYEAFIGGNYGIPFSSFADKTTENSITVLELSSFQIEDLKTFKSDVGVILNVTPDHLNRYSSFEEYAEVKKSFVKFCEVSILNYDDPILKNLEGNVKFFSFKERKDAFFDGRKIIAEGYELSVDALPLKGVHNIENYMAAALTLLELGVKWGYIEKGFRTFRGLPHRVEEVAVINGVKFINDSKSTNVDSLRKALLSFNNIVLIAGGVDKGLDFSPVLPLLKERVKAAVVIGDMADKLESLFSKVIPVKKAETMEEAVKLAYGLANGSGVVLLSPGCASFDMFRSFEERGEAFKTCVKQLEAELEL
ncbi:UDP-N-acetylmuramoylalanine--D-glutamate ligase [Desulfurobacterium pacificum]|uniref:UDP-N-acetylmuramoylalanine--D-glutamate ligase n=1 Tax=Desulfurobacterium pacificum TaxID=240166 RepID=A0ABY1N8Z8_9BACT|nr:UDP-N-acetylmuramoyl-L-alanine--D-glutamate ligase [Desulfurobacterium pacificum]SMP03727.1 UDP-N-acetylmuramoylalanine--D-glutamate ligase [Desulfurobacterium pacificum]